MLYCMRGCSHVLLGILQAGARGQAKGSGKARLNIGKRFTRALACLRLLLGCLGWQVEPSEALRQAGHAALTWLAAHPAVAARRDDELLCAQPRADQAGVAGRGL